MDGLFLFLFLLIVPIVLLIARATRPSTYRMPSTRWAAVQLGIAFVALVYLVWLAVPRVDRAPLPSASWLYALFCAWVVYRAARRLYWAYQLDQSGVLVQAVGVDIRLGGEDEQRGVSYIYGDDHRGQSPVRRWVRRVSNSNRVVMVVRYLPDRPEVHRIDSIECEGQVLLGNPPEGDIPISQVKSRAQKQRERAQEIQDLPDELMIAGLDQPIAEYTMGTKRKVLPGVLTIVLAVILTSSLLLALQADSLDDACPGYGLAGLALLILIFGISLLIDREVRFLVFAEGLVRLQRKQIHSFCWETVRSVKQRIWWDAGGRIRHRYTIERGDGAKLTLNDRIPFVDDLMTELEKSRLKFELPLQLRAYQSGRSLSFGMLTLDTRELHYEDKMIPVQDIGGARIDWAQKGGLLKIRRRGRWQALPGVDVGETPDLTVLVGILQKLGAPQANPALAGASQDVSGSDLTGHPHYAPVLEALHEASQAAPGTFVTLVSEPYVVQFLNMGEKALMLDVPLMHWQPAERDRVVDFYATLPSSGSQGLGSDTLNADFGGSMEELEQAAQAALALFLDVLMLDRDFELQIQLGK
jgi:hypothetical protein